MYTYIYICTYDIHILQLSTWLYRIVHPLSCFDFNHALLLKTSNIITSSHLLVDANFLCHFFLRIEYGGRGMVILFFPIIIYTVSRALSFDRLFLLSLCLSVYLPPSHYVFLSLSPLSPSLSTSLSPSLACVHNPGADRSNASDIGHFTHSPSHQDTLTHTYTHMRTHTNTHTLWIGMALHVMLSHTHTLTHTHTHTHTHT